MRYEQQTRQVARQKMGAKLIAAAHILEMSSVELADRLEQELAANPALEVVQEYLCPRCRAPLRGGACPYCDPQRTQRDAPEGLAQYLSEPPLPRPRVEPSEDDLEDPYLRAETPPTLQEHLRLQARTALGADDYPIADYLIANINDRGLLDCDPAEAARDLDLPPERVERVLAAIQGFDPPGAGARTPQQALLIQLRQLEDEGRQDGCAEAVIRDHWQDLANQAYTKIARALGVTRDEVEHAAEFIRDNLDPYPGRQFRAFWQHQPNNPEAIARPDAIIRREVDEYVVEVVESPEQILRISDSYRQLYRALAGYKRGFVPAESREAVESLKRADWFIQSLRMRRRTLQTVTEAIVRIQQPFLDTGLEEKLKKLTRANLARGIGKHESTVSRALANKFVLLPAPANRIISYDCFFTAALSVKSVIGQLVQRESPYRPLTDRQIRQILESRGYKVARRTVAKYRLALNIASSEHRGRH